MARTKRSNGNKGSNIDTQNNAPTSSSDQETQASLPLNNTDSQQHSKDELMSIIQIQDQKIQNLTNRLNNLEQLVHEWQSDALLSKRTSELLVREVDCLKQYSRRSYLVISGVKLPEGKNKETAAETTEKVKELLTGSLHIDPTVLSNEIYKIHRLPLTNKQKQTENQTLYVSLKLIAIEKNFSPRKMGYTIIATRKSSFMSV